MKNLIPLLVLTMCHGSPVTSQTYVPYDDHVWIDPEAWYEHAENQPYFGSIMHYNIDRSPLIDTYDLETPHGVVQIQIEHTMNNKCTPACPDTISVLGLPEGVVAIPHKNITAENSMFAIRLYLYEGS